MALRRITQQTLIDILTAGREFQAKYLETCRLVSGLAAQLPLSDLREAIIQLTTNAEFDLHAEATLFTLEQGRIEGTQARNEYLRRRREEKAEGPYKRPDEGDELDGFGRAATVDFIDDEAETAEE